MQKILSGKKVAAKIKDEVKAQISKMRSHNIIPTLKIIIVGIDSASEYYAKNILKNSKAVGIKADLLKFPQEIKEEILIAKIKELNTNTDIHAIQIMMPLPKNISFELISNTIDPKKDVDCLNPINMGRLVLGKNTFQPNTPAAVLKLLEYYNLDTDGKKVVILGRSDIVGKPLANLLIRKNEPGNATVTICHSHTKNLTQITKSADILIVAIGKPKFITRKFVSKHSIIIDVGINKILDKDTKQEKYVGDVDFDDVEAEVTAITPVPGGVGSITTAALLANISKASRNIISDKK